MSPDGFGIDIWFANIDWGDGSATVHASVSGGIISNPGVNDFTEAIWGGVLSGPGNLDHTYEADGTYTITVTITNTPLGYNETQTLTVTVGSTSLPLSLLARESASAYSID